MQECERSVLITVRGYQWAVMTRVSCCVSEDLVIAVHRHHLVIVCVCIAFVQNLEGYQPYEALKCSVGQAH